MRPSKSERGSAFCTSLSRTAFPLRTSGASSSGPGTCNVSRCGHNGRAQRRVRVPIRASSSEEARTSSEGTGVERRLADMSLVSALSSDDVRNAVPKLIKLSRTDTCLHSLRASTALTSSALSIRTAALAALGRIGDEHDMSALIDKLRDDTEDTGARSAAASALGVMLRRHRGEGGGAWSGGFQRGLEALIGTARREDGEKGMHANAAVRAAAMGALGECGAEGVVATMVAVGEDGDALERAAVARALGEVPDAVYDAQARTWVLARVTDRDALVRGAVALTLASWQRAGGVGLQMHIDEMARAEQGLAGSDYVREVLRQVRSEEWWHASREDEEDADNGTRA